jgi:predicted Zn-dependent protease
MPGGKIMVYSGLIEQLQLSDAELATVIGHEMAHALREHSREAVSRAYAQQLGLGAFGVLAGLGQDSMQLAGMITDVTFTLPRSRVQESEADKVGLELMARAGYDPHAALTLWQKMGQASQAGTPAFLNTHPSSSTRLEDLRALLPRVLPLYDAAPRH